MAQASDYMESAVLTGLLGGTSITLSSGKPYIALLTSAPSDSSSGTECTGGGYARVQIGDTNQGDFTIDSTGQATNSAEFKFDDATGNWGNITHIALMDASTAGNMLLYGSLTTPVAINTGDIFKIPASGFTIQMD